MRTGLLDPVGTRHPARERADSALARPSEPLPPELTDDLADDLHLERLLAAMSDGDRLTRDAARQVLLHPRSDPAVIEHRQRALSDCLHHRERVEELFTLCQDALAVRRDILWLPLRGHPSSELSSNVRRLGALADHLEGLHTLCAGIEDEFSSPAFRDLAARLAPQTCPSALDDLRALLRELALPDGLLVTAGARADGTVDPVLPRRTGLTHPRLLTRLPMGHPRETFVLPERDQAGGEALAALRDRALGELARLTTDAVEEITGFFADLRRELAFYRGAVRLVDTLRGLGAPVCWPDPGTPDTTAALGLYDPCLALQRREAPVGNDLELHGAGLLVVTGANEGGKSTLLRALGLAQLMMQAGMAVAAEQFAARPVGRVLTHFAREEDAQLVHGKLDEELERMHRIVEAIAPADLLLCNESFASTDEAEGSELLLEVTRALVDGGVQIRTVTHLFDFADSLAQDEDVGAAFLRAPRDGGYRLAEGPPLRTSFGVDLYDRTFGTTLAHPRTRPRSDTPAVPKEERP
ncbi:MutS-related protein [Brachybacterium kimchii]|uniref:DNA mismatch repair proteins mutS family domain-containing protein n=1 Tax=Brachybacterium kimchii TaxID=2942909 RepID=A0ABY4N4G9_9MICO|nr:hypothetical protein [Brachybacterium kimchii]UQN28751.1 hypothetical protein M4486_14130 [Brachybacterium kimchii]